MSAHELDKLRRRVSSEFMLDECDKLEGVFDECWPDGQPVIERRMIATIRALNERLDADVVRIDRRVRAMAFSHSHGYAVHVGCLGEVEVETLFCHGCDRDVGARDVVEPFEWQQESMRIADLISRYFNPGAYGG